MTIFNNYDDCKKALFNPSDVISKKDSFPKLCVTTFSKKIIDKLVSDNNVNIIGELHSANGTNPIYEINYKGNKIAFYLSLIGAPACASIIEEIIAMGVEKLVVFGSCGLLDEKCCDKIIIPSSAIRDEGTSYHYYKASEEMEMDVTSIDVLKNVLSNLDIPYVIGKTWTTDAIYRETIKIVNERKKQGCVAVDMECSAALSVAKYRGIRFAQFLYGADSLDNDSWNERDLHDHGLTHSNKYLTIAFESVISL